MSIRDKLKEWQVSNFNELYTNSLVLNRIDPNLLPNSIRGLNAVYLGKQIKPDLQSGMYEYIDFYASTNGVGRELQVTRITKNNEVGSYFRMSIPEHYIDAAKQHKIVTKLLIHNNEEAMLSYGSLVLKIEGMTNDDKS